MKFTNKLFLYAVTILLVHSIHSSDTSSTKKTKTEYADLPKELQLIIVDYAGLNDKFDSPLKHAIFLPDHNAVQLFIALGVDVNQSLLNYSPLNPSLQRTSPLSCAIQRYHCAQTDKSTAMYRCYDRINRCYDEATRRDKVQLANGHIAKSYLIFNYLLRHNADYNAIRGPKEEPPLHATVRYGYAHPLLDRLLDLPNINVHLQDKFGHTALYYAQAKLINENLSWCRDHCARYSAICRALENKMQNKTEDTQQIVSITKKSKNKNRNKNRKPSIKASIKTEVTNSKPNIKTNTTVKIKKPWR